MTYQIGEIAERLKRAREAKGLSQRALSARAGVPQGHLSKIENAAIDIRLSSLIQLARSLDLELTLIPRKALPAVEGIVRAVTGQRGENGDQPPGPAYSLEDDDG
jgi:transcriptional regulator with XRE-family HTH domain